MLTCLTGKSLSQRAASIMGRMRMETQCCPRQNWLCERGILREYMSSWSVVKKGMRHTHNISQHRSGFTTETNGNLSHLPKLKLCFSHTQSREQVFLTNLIPLPTPLRIWNTWLPWLPHQGKLSMMKALVASAEHQSLPAFRLLARVCPVSSV